MKTELKTDDAQPGGDRWQGLRDRSATESPRAPDFNRPGNRGGVDHLIRLGMGETERNPMKTRHDHIALTTCRIVISYPVVLSQWIKSAGE
ncbi:MAG: hypothetical protein HC826_00215 [Rhodospirillales bacterium]|nr:hypothetical protein [Rhodospirillales bacterium]